MDDHQEFMEQTNILQGWKPHGGELFSRIHVALTSNPISQNGIMRSRGDHVQRLVYVPNDWGYEVFG